MKRFPFVPSKDSVPIGIEVVKVIFWWASKWQSVAIFFLKIFLCLITHLLTKLFIFCHSGVIDALQTQTRKAYWELPVSQFSQGKSCFIFIFFQNIKYLLFMYLCILLFPIVQQVFEGKRHGIHLQNGIPVFSLHFQLWLPLV